MAQEWFQENYTDESTMNVPIKKITNENNNRISAGTSIWLDMCEFVESARTSRTHTRSTVDCHYMAGALCKKRTMTQSAPQILQDKFYSSRNMEPNEQIFYVQYEY